LGALHALCKASGNGWEGNGLPEGVTAEKGTKRPSHPTKVAFFFTQFTDYE